MSVVALMLCPLVPESARWLLSQGRLKEATAVVQQIAAWNGTQVPPVPLKAAQYSQAGATEAANSAAGAAVDKSADSIPTGAAVNSSDESSMDQQAVESSDGVLSPADLQIMPPAAGAAGNSSDSSPVLPATAGQGAGSAQRVHLLAALHQPKLLIRTVLVVFTWFALYTVSFGVNLGVGMLPGSV